MREAKARKLDKADDQPKLPVLIQERITRSSQKFKKVENLFQPCVVDLGLLTAALEKCQACGKGPLQLQNINHNVKFQGSCPILSVPCKLCSEINVIRPNKTHRTGTRGPPVFDVNTRAALGSLRSGIGHTHYSSLSATMGIAAMSASVFKNREREAGNAIETVAKRTCLRNAEEEKQLSKSGDGEEMVDVAVSYDMSWRKRGKAYDFSSGMGSAIGVTTGKVISYATRNLECRICKHAEESQSSPRAHDCRHNYQGSSKSMESSVAVQLFNEAPANGMRFSTYVGDEDSTTESRLKVLVDYDIEKWTDLNHAKRTLGSRLYAMKGKVKGMTNAVISYIQKCFGYAIKKNQNNASGMKKSLELIIPHAFGDHDGCRDMTWCKFKDDPENYVHSDLPGG